jgi:hypothetical protein
MHYSLILIPVAKNKKPAERYRVSGPELLKSAVIKSAISGVHRPPTRCARDDDGGDDGDESASRKEYGELQAWSTSYRSRLKQYFGCDG